MKFLDLWNNLSFFQAASMVAALILTVGAIVEYWPKLKPLTVLLLKLALLRSNKFERCTLRKLLLHAVAPLLVVLGIGGELLFESRSFIIEDQESDVLRTRAEREIEARITLEKELLRQGPRAPLLRAAHIGTRLARFAGQVVYVFDCEGERLKYRSPVPSDMEVVMASFRIAHELTYFGHWRAILDNKKCDFETVSGIEVAVNPSASRATYEAGEALTSVLRAALLATAGEGPVLREAKFGAPSPRVPGDPNEVIVVHVGPHPLR
ncbi:MAG TPA: hypothetical protein VNV82_14835 [Bryobacteraceae bacterium]|jgi:hypothetical protein|nr:hypothetical protein [Bryobacteraceae bacterium]